MQHILEKSSLFQINHQDAKVIQGQVIPSNQYFAEEERSKQSSLFTLIREIRNLFYHDNANQLGLYGAFGYDLTFQFEEIALQKARDSNQHDVILYLPDEILIIDNQKNDAWKIHYDFMTSDEISTVNKKRSNVPGQETLSPYVISNETIINQRDYPKGQYAEQVRQAKEEFRLGNLFEVVLSQAFREKMHNKPSEVFKR